MSNTFNRQPLSFNSPDNEDLNVNIFSQFNWKGIDENANVLSTDQESFEDCDNVFVNDDFILTSRPNIELILSNEEDVKYYETQSYIILYKPKDSTDRLRIISTRGNDYVCTTVNMSTNNVIIPDDTELYFREINGVLFVFGTETIYTVNVSSSTDKNDNEVITYILSVAGANIYIPDAGDVKNLLMPNAKKLDLTVKADDYDDLLLMDVFDSTSMTLSTDLNGKSIYVGNLPIDRLKYVLLNKTKFEKFDNGTFIVINNVPYYFYYNYRINGNDCHIDLTLKSTLDGVIHHKEIIYSVNDSDKIYVDLQFIDTYKSNALYFIIKYDAYRITDTSDVLQSQGVSVIKINIDDVNLIANRYDCNSSLHSQYVHFYGLVNDEFNNLRLVVYDVNVYGVILYLYIYSFGIDNSLVLDAYYQSSDSYLDYDLGKFIQGGLSDGKIKTMVSVRDHYRFQTVILSSNKFGLILQNDDIYLQNDSIVTFDNEVYTPGVVSNVKELFATEFAKIEDALKFVEDTLGDEIYITVKYVYSETVGIIEGTAFDVLSDARNRLSAGDVSKDTGWKVYEVGTIAKAIVSRRESPLFNDCENLIKEFDNVILSAKGVVEDIREGLDTKGFANDILKMKSQVSDVTKYATYYDINKGYYNLSLTLKNVLPLGSVFNGKIYDVCFHEDAIWLVSEYGIFTSQKTDIVGLLNIADDNVNYTFKYSNSDSIDMSNFFPTLITSGNDELLYIVNTKSYLLKIIVEEGITKLYLPEGKDNDYCEKVINAVGIGNDTNMVVTKNAVWHVTDTGELDDNKLPLYKYVKTKLNLNTLENSEIITAQDGATLLVPTYQGLAALSYNQIISTAEQIINYISNNIYKRWHTYIKNKNISLCNYKHYLFVYSPNSTECYLYDYRFNTWWHWSFDEEIRFIHSLDDYYFIGLDSGFYKFNDNDLHNKWFIKSQKLHLNAINNNKQIRKFIVYCNDDGGDGDERLTNLRIQFNNYRKRFYKEDSETIEFNVDFLRTYIKYLNYPNVLYFQYTISNDDNIDEMFMKPLKLNGISINYKIGGEIK